MCNHNCNQGRNCNCAASAREFHQPTEEKPMTQVLVFDTETTGKTEPQIIEAAWIRLTGTPAQAKPDLWFCRRYKPSRPIELGAMATHHIMAEDLEECAPSSEFSLPSGVDYIVGHNIDYDWEVAGKPEIRRICTLALCRATWPDLDAYNQTAMLYHLERNKARQWSQNAHSASVDVENCLVVLEHVIKVSGVASWDALWELSEKSRVPTVMPFGKHKGVPIRQVPADYKAWLLKQADIDPYLKKALTPSK